ncbi:hypothetical protein MMC34_004512 [Xylographa carneopallida]|nr:hypothetical protein [Xylographa carneopallida]
MANFLDLAREIRDLIYGLVLKAEIGPPPSPVENMPRNIHGLMPLQKPVIVNSTVLLLINQQIHHETKEVVHDLAKRGRITYKLDCMIVDGKRVYPTWLSIPAYSTIVSKVEVNFRLTLDYNEFLLGRLPRIRDTIPYYPFRVLHQSFLKSPDSAAGPGWDDITQIDELILTIVTPPPVTPRRVLRSTGMPNPDKVARYCSASAEAVLKITTEKLGFLIRGLSHSSINSSMWHGALQKIHVVKIRSDGELRKTWNVRETAYQDCH